MKQHMPAIAVGLVGVVVTFISIAAIDGQSRQEKILADFEKETGLKAVQIPNTEGSWLGKAHRGYQVLYTARAGNVWGRYAARLTMAETGKEVGGVLGYLTGQNRSGVGGVTGSPLDRLLSTVIGQPLSVTMIVRHDKGRAPRLDILSGCSVIQPEEKLPQRQKLGSRGGFLCAADGDFAARIAGNEVLMKRMKDMRCQYIRLDDDAVSFFWAGSETDYSGMIRDHGGYYKMINSIMDDLADIADAIPVLR
ncbi:MAG TPA: hypothetical protein VN461_08340 [Vicinamibacteria bacterium]|jgi:hypothetical protein|nr:hypothetical protein [Vicinamibacteria bacterium]